MEDGVESSLIRAVGRAVCEGQIRVRHRPNQGNVARYHSDGDTIALPFRRAADWFCKAQIVHEATHAAADMLGANWMCIQTSEAAAHIAQSLYMIHYTSRSPRQSGSRSRPGSLKTRRSLCSVTVAWACSPLVWAQRLDGI